MDGMGWDGMRRRRITVLDMDSFFIVFYFFKGRMLIGVLKSKSTVQVRK